MTNEEREALNARARATQCHETCDETNHRMVDALLSALDEARGQLAALHGTVAEVLAEPHAYIGARERAILNAALSDAAAAAKAHEARGRESVERERDAAIARADAAETTLSNLRALRLGDQLDEMRAERNKAREERDTMSAALAEIARLRAAYLDAQRWALDAENMRVALSRKYGRRPYLFADYVAAKERSAALGLAAAEAEVAYEAALSALPADLAAQRDARARAEAREKVRALLAVERAQPRDPIADQPYPDGVIAGLCAALRALDEAEKGGA